MKMILQHDERDCGAACLASIAGYYGLKKPLSFFRELTKTDRCGTNLYGLVDAAQTIGLRAEALSGTPEELMDGIQAGQIRFPFIAHIRSDQDMLHFVVVMRIKGGRICLGDPGKGKISMTLPEFFQRFTGYIVTFEKTEAFTPKKENPGTLRRFFVLLKGQYRKLVGVALISLVISLIGIYSAYVFEIVIDVFYTQSASDEGDPHDHAEESHEADSEPAGDGESAETDPAHTEEAAQSGYWLDSLAIVQSFGDSISWIGDRILSSSFHLVFAILIALYLLQALIQYIRGILISQVARKIDIGMAMTFYRHLTDLPVSSIATRLTGEYLSRFSDTYTIRNAISTATLTLILDTVMVFSCGLMLYFQNQKLFCVSLITVALYALIVLAYRKPVERSNRTVMENSAVVESYFKETIDGIETVKAANAEPVIQAKAAKKFSRFANSAYRNNLLAISLDTLSTAVELIGTAVILWIGFSMVLLEQVTIGQVIAFYMLLSMFTEPIKNLIDLQPTIQTALVAADRLNDVLDLTREQRPETGEPLPTVTEWTLEHVDFRYGNHELTLKNISFSLRRGEKIAIVGESGSGKTTLAKLLLRFYEPERGRILADGTDIRQRDLTALRESVAYVDQNTFLFADTIRNNLKLSNPEATDERIWEVCDICHASEFIRKLPLGLDTPLDENGMNLSGGQRQRLSIARALLKDPQLLILDEATSNLDTVTESSIKSTIFALDRELTCIIIAHRLTTIRQCDRILVMADGGIAETGTHEELLRKNGIYARLWERQ